MRDWKLEYLAECAQRLGDVEAKAEASASDSPPECQYAAKYGYVLGTCHSVLRSLRCVLSVSLYDDHLDALAENDLRDQLAGEQDLDALPGEELQPHELTGVAAHGQPLGVV